MKSNDDIQLGPKSRLDDLKMCFSFNSLPIYVSNSFLRTNSGICIAKNFLEGISNIFF